jgi:hypothetical protein
MTIGTMAEQRFDDEASLAQYLSILYTQPFDYPERQVMVGGRIVHLMSFHYPATNVEAPKNKAKCEYIDRDNMLKLFSYELKGALCTSAVQVK